VACASANGAPIMFPLDSLQTLNANAFLKSPDHHVNPNMGSSQMADGSDISISTPIDCSNVSINIILCPEHMMSDDDEMTHQLVWCRAHYDVNLCVLGRE